MTLAEKCGPDLGSHRVDRQAVSGVALWRRQKSPCTVGEVIMRSRFAQVSLRGLETRGTRNL